MIPELDFDDEVMPVKKLTGIHYDLSNEAYHAHDSISKSGLDLIDQSPAHFKSSVRKETTAFKQGTAIHCAVLEPDELDNRYFFIPEKLDLRTTYGKSKNQEYALKNEGKILLSLEEYQMLCGIRREVSKHKLASQLFDGGKPEVSFFSQIDGVDVRCRPDYWNGSIVVDLKSTDCASEKQFKKSVINYRYFVQHPFYVDVMASEGIDIDAFLFVAVEKTEPFGIGVFELDENFIEYGRLQYQKNLDTYKRCLDTGLWPCYPEHLQTIELPNYLAREL